MPIHDIGGDNPRYGLRMQAGVAAHQWSLPAGSVAEALRYETPPPGWRPAAGERVVVAKLRRERWRRGEEAAMPPLVGREGCYYS